MRDLTDTNLQLHGFSVHVTGVDGYTEVMCRNVPGKDAALGFWHYANNFSAKAGLVNRVEIQDTFGKTLLAWEFERGYTFDGREFSDKPILMDS